MRWLIKAEGLHVDVDELDWEMLATMGSGSVGGLDTFGIANYQ